MERAPAQSQARDNPRLKQRVTSPHREPGLTSACHADKRDDTGFGIDHPSDFSQLVTPAIERRRSPGLARLRTNPRCTAR